MGIVVAVTVILLLAFLFVIFQRLRLSRRRNRPLSLNIDSNGKELVPLNSTRNGDLPDFKRSSKMSNLEMTQVNLLPFSLLLRWLRDASIKLQQHHDCFMIFKYSVMVLTGSLIRYLNGYIHQSKRFNQLISSLLILIVKFTYDK